MTFKLENIDIEGMEDSEKQKIIAEYNFGKKKGLSEDRTFCLFYEPPDCDCHLYCDNSCSPYNCTDICRCHDYPTDR
jgi:hypothetical protein